MSPLVQLLLRLSLSDTISTVSQCYLMVSFGLQVRAGVSTKGWSRDLSWDGRRTLNSLPHPGASQESLFELNGHKRGQQNLIVAPHVLVIWLVVLEKHKSIQPLWKPFQVVECKTFAKVHKHHFCSWAEIMPLFIRSAIREWYHILQYKQFNKYWLHYEDFKKDHMQIRWIPVFGESKHLRQNLLVYFG